MPRCAALPRAAELRFAVVIIVVLACMTGGSLAAELAIVGGTVVDPAKGEAPATVLVHGGRIVADADPLVSIANLRKLSTVVIRGKVLDAAALKYFREMAP